MRFKHFYFLLIFLIPLSLFAQKKVTGKVIGINGEPMVGANVLWENQNKVTITDVEGNFSFENVPERNQVFKTTYLGYQDVEFIREAEDKQFVIRMKPTAFLLESPTISAVRADAKSPFTYSNVTKEELDVLNLGQDVPYLLRWQPSTVVTSDAGTGIGYTGLRIRGSDPSRINVTINGIPLNDAESQFVFWVDLPDFATSTNDIQIQRGVGTSTNGAGAFGGTINLNTTKVNLKPFAEINATVGSFNTRKINGNFSTGLLNDKWVIDGRVSQITSDGWIDRGTSDLFSWYGSAAYVGKTSSLRFNAFSGHEVTYQAWCGVPQQFQDDETLRTFNTCGQISSSGEFYENQVDDYTQTHFQLLYNKDINLNSGFSTALYYTRGLGFFEQYENNADLGFHGVTPINDTTFSSDLTRRRWLDNHLVGGIFNYTYKSTDEKLDVTLGAGANVYFGGHFGHALWVGADPSLTDFPNYYDNDAQKEDYNFYAKVGYNLTPKLNGFIDLQARGVRYEFLGFDENTNNVTQTDDLLFFNPKFGFFYETSQNGGVYASFAVANREPNRDDYTESSPLSRPQAETLYDTEVGFRQNWKKAAFEATGYLMSYDDQLVLTGQINDVGAFTRTNVDDSYRLGLELVGGVELIDGLNLQGNLTLSQNKIREFTEFIDVWDTGGQEQVLHENTNLAFSPNIISGGELSYNVLHNTDNNDLTFSLLGKYVGKQYIDNTSNENTALDAYFFGDFRVVYTFKSKWFDAISINFLVQNVLDQSFINNAWTYRYISEGFDGREFDPYTQLEDNATSTYNLTGFYPQAGRNFLLGISLKF